MKVLSYKRGRHTQDTRRIIVDAASSRSEAQQLVGKKVVVEYGKGFEGVITKPHGTKGKVIVKLDKPLPGQAINAPVKLLNE
ncbi:MAG TPA: 50S ribosomal protein L35ae [Candidatus Aenigmarchaeota archaeon]|nr:MAG: 50S ribosomal protein L35ae [Nanoarchaeota archaeon]HDO79783.1 50S ribosomal protein L35ae [Candidatus Aenigmarchaeota archaeon]HEX32835.1 50S ribosomal protein L35ae [Candidatus Aenigmarchaeota archaeon]